jgi:hypothetical protein
MQQTRLRKRCRRQGVYSYDEQRHVATWEGSIRIGPRKTRRKHALKISWPAATPFVPPLIIPVGKYSVMHQLRDGSMCLLGKADTDRGWEGVVNIDVWLDKAEGWLLRYQQEGWGIDPHLWPFHAVQMPRARYRQDLPQDALIVGIPPALESDTPGVGRLRLLVPESKRGLAAVLKWEHDGVWHSWAAAKALVHGERSELPGVWIRLGHPMVNPAQPMFSDQQKNARMVEASHEALTEAAKDDGRFVLLNRFVHIEPTESAFWNATIRSLEDFAKLASPLGLLDVLTNRDDHTGFVLDERWSGGRRGHGRSKPMNHKIANCQFVLVGLGALGSEVAHLLAQEGATRFMLVDADLMLPGNEARHRAGLDQAGLPKVEVAERLIRQVQPEAEIDTVHAWFDELAPTLSVDERGDTLMIGMTGDEGLEHFISDSCKAWGTPCLHAWTELEGRVLRLVRYLPGKDPTLSRVHGSRERPRLPRPEPGEQAATECAEVALPGAAVNLHAAANFVARCALDLAAGIETRENHWLFSPGGVNEDEVPERLRGAYGALALRID